MKQYLDLLRDIKENGVRKHNRTGIDTYSVFGRQMRFDLSKGFPAITTKKLAFKSVKSELLWFLEGSDDERRLAEIHHGLPRENLVGKTTIWTANADNQGKNLGYENTDFVKKLGPIYGVQWRKWKKQDGLTIDQIGKLIEKLKHNPDDRRMILSAYNVGELEQMALPPCHSFSQFYVVDNKLSCMLTQRSGDAFLGIPFNIASYSLLTYMLAQVCGLKVGEFIHSIGDVHIYENHIKQVDLQLSRQPLALPTLWLNPDVKNIDDFKMDDIRLENYHSYDAIKASMAV